MPAVRTSCAGRLHPVRVNGEMHGPEEKITLDKKKKHNWKWWWNRLVVKESSPAADRLRELPCAPRKPGPGGQAGQERNVLFRTFACDRSAASATRTDPRRCYTFNTPMACPSCDAWHHDYFDPDLIVPNPSCPYFGGKARRPGPAHLWSITIQLCWKPWPTITMSNSMRAQGLPKGQQVVLNGRAKRKSCSFFKSAPPE
jgi:excinuclease UvrABC ATPase subunit